MEILISSINIVHVCSQVSINDAHRRIMQHEVHTDSTLIALPWTFIASNKLANRQQQTNQPFDQSIDGTTNILA